MRAHLAAMFATVVDLAESLLAQLGGPCGFGAGRGVGASAAADHHSLERDLRAWGSNLQLACYWALIATARPAQALPT